MNHIIDSKPSSYEEASSEHVWKNAMMEEYQTTMKNEVWEIVSIPEGKSVVTSKWIYKMKHGVDGNIEKQKAIFVAYVMILKGDGSRETIKYSILVILY